MSQHRKSGCGSRIFIKSPPVTKLSRKCRNDTVLLLLRYWNEIQKVVAALRKDWLDEYIIQLNSESRPKVDPIATALEAIRGQLAGLQQQQDNLCDYLEKGVYTIEMFTKRNATLAREIKQLQASEADLMRKQESGSQASQAAMELIPTTQHILDNYDVLTIAEKNRLWKLVLKKATVYRTPDGELSVHIYPKLPK